MTRSLKLSLVSPAESEFYREIHAELLSAGNVDDGVDLVCGSCNKLMASGVEIENLDASPMRVLCPHCRAANRLS